MYAGAAMCRVMSGVPEAVAEGVRILKEAASDGNTEAQVSLASLYRLGTGVEKDQQEALRLYESAAKKSLRGKSALGGYLVHSEGTAKDQARGEKLLQEAAESGDAIAQYNLALGYSNGKTLPANVSLSVKYKLMLQDNSDPAAIGLREYLRQFEAQQQSDLDDLIRLANETGDADTECAVGEVYLQRAKYSEAYEWFMKASGKDSMFATFKLSRMYDEALGRPRDPAKALTLLQLVAERGHTAAHNKLAEKYVQGDAVERNIRKALMWFKVAAELGSKKGIQRFQEVSQGVEADVLAAATSEAIAFVRSKPGLPTTPNDEFIVVKKKFVPDTQTNSVN